ncbi:hypothetical protein KXV85_003332, partial [Aspergillus fumigatus]
RRDEFSSPHVSPLRDSTISVQPRLLKGPRVPGGPAAEGSACSSRFEQKQAGTAPLFCGSLLLVVASPSFAQHYPNRPVRVVVGFPPGGPTDVIARIVAQNLSDSLGQQFFVENIPGAGSNTASGQVARAAPDGYTIMGISTGFIVNPSLYAKVPYDPIKDFTAVTL